MTATQEEIAAAWSAWQSRHGGKLGPGPAFVEAINAALAIRLPTLESLQRENEELRQDRDRTERNRDMYKGQVERQAYNLSWYRSGSFAHAINEHLADAGISINGDILHDCIRRTALASTGGEHHGY